MPCAQADRIEGIGAQYRGFCRELRCVLRGRSLGRIASSSTICRTGGQKRSRFDSRPAFEGQRVFS